MSRRRSRSADQTAAMGAALAAGLGGGDLVLIRGEVGTGKTTFVRGACRALGVAGPVVSPTFTIGRRYRGRVPVSHLDLYRLEDVSAEDPGLLDDYLTDDAVAFVEWPGEVDLGPVTAQVELFHAGGDEREIEISYESY